MGAAWETTEQTDTEGDRTGLPVWIRETGTGADTSGRWLFHEDEDYILAFSWVPNSTGVCRNTKHDILHILDKTVEWVTNMQVSIHVRVPKP